MRGFVTDDELVQLYGNALGVCYLPFDEDYGYVTLEGMLSGKPVVVARDGGGATEFIEHDSEGLVVEPDPQDAQSPRPWTRFIGPPLRDKNGRTRARKAKGHQSFLGARRGKANQCRWMM